MPMTEHPHRQAMQDEVHARPPLMIAAERAEVWQWVLVPDTADATWPEAIDMSRSHQVLDLDGGLVRVERHTEFVTLTYCGDTVPAPHIVALVDACPAQLLTGARIKVAPEHEFQGHVQNVRSYVFGTAAQDKVRLETDFRVSEHRLIEYAVSGRINDGIARGRLIKLVLDLETYRMAALLSLPAVRERTPQLHALELSARTVATALATARDVELGEAVTALSSIQAEVGALQEIMRYRLAASRAYYDLVQARLDTLEEQAIGQQQTLANFIGLRLTPAIKTINAYERRLNELSINLQSTMALVRTRLDLILQSQNQSLLRSMEKRARQQVKLAEAVEGLSTMAISYYVVGLFAYLLGAVPLSTANKSLWIALAVPLIVAVVWRLTRRAGRRYKHSDESP